MNRQDQLIATIAEHFGHQPKEFQLLDNGSKAIEIVLAESPINLIFYCAISPAGSISMDLSGGEEVAVGHLAQLTLLNTHGNFMHANWLLPSPDEEDHQETGIVSDFSFVTWMDPDQLFEQHIELLRGVVKALAPDWGDCEHDFTIAYGAALPSPLVGKRGELAIYYTRHLTKQEGRMYFRVHKHVEGSELIVLTSSLRVATHAVSLLRRKPWMSPQQAVDIAIKAGTMRPVEPLI